MVEILNFKKGATVIKLNTAVTNLNVQGNVITHCGIDKNMEHIHLTG
jgi:hypothetical protein